MVGVEDEDEDEEEVEVVEDVVLLDEVVSMKTWELVLEDEDDDEDEDVEVLVLVGIEEEVVSTAAEVVLVELTLVLVLVGVTEVDENWVDEESEVEVAVSKGSSKIPAALTIDEERTATKKSVRVRAVRMVCKRSTTRSEAGDEKTWEWMWRRRGRALVSTRLLRLAHSDPGNSHRRFTNMMHASAVR